MKKILPFLGVIILIAIVVLGIFLMKPKTAPVTSDDGMLTLDIVASALPGHISRDDITIEKLENFPLLSDDQAPLVAYNLGPNGLSLLEPVNFTLDVPVKENEIPAIYHLSDYGISKINKVDIKIDDTKQTATVKGTIDHFSYFYVSIDGLNLMLTSPKEANVGEAVQVKGTTQIVRKVTEWVMADSYEAFKNPFQKAMFDQWKEAAGMEYAGGNLEVGHLKYKMPWTLQGKMKADPAAVITPASIDEAPAKTSVNSESYTYTGTFNCKTPGKATFDYTVQVYTDMEMEWYIQPPFDIHMDFPNEPTTITKVSHTECKAVPLGEEGIGGGGVGDGDGEGEEPEDGEEEEAEPEEELEEEEEECPDCDALEEQLEDLENKKEELEDKIEEKEQELKDAEFTEELLDADLDALINDAGCNPNQDPGGGATQSGESSGKVTSRGRSFFCPNEAAAEAMVEALKEFWEDNKSPSTVRNELKQLKRELGEINFQIMGVKFALEDCPCERYEIGDLLQIEIDIFDPCTEILKKIQLVPETEESVEFKVGGGDIPEWIEFDPSEGKLPQEVEVKVDCEKVGKLEPGEHKVETEVEIFNKEKKKMKAIPVNMIFGILLVEGEDEEKIAETPSVGPVMVSPPFIDFIYDHGMPVCPLPIDPIQVTGPVGGEWVLNTEPPIWLDVSQTSGTIPATIDLQFPCMLDRYENQEQTEKLTYTITTPDGQTTVHEVEIKGTFTNF